MKTIKTRFLASITLLSLALSHSSCDDETDDFTLSKIQTIEAYNITSNTVTSGGIILSDGSPRIIEKGICWDINPLPTREMNTKKISEIDSSTFKIDLSDLKPDTRYYLRAYAVNALGTSYGNEVSFVTNKNSSIQYFTDGRSVQYGDPSPIALDITADGMVDFTIFIEATASSRGVRLYAGINPIRDNKVKSGPAIDENFLNMGFIIPQRPGSVIDHSREIDQQWTQEFSALVIRNTDNNGIISYEGFWVNPEEIIGVHFRVEDSIHYGWLRIKFDKATEVVTLIDYAWNSISNQEINAGAVSN